MTELSPVDAMTNEVTFEPAKGCPPPPPDALIQFEVDALAFIVCGVEVFRLTSSGMEYKGQTVEDAGVVYREVTTFFSAVKEAVNSQSPADHMTNDYRAMCAELLAWAERTSSNYYKQADVIVRARALLAQPVAEGPTD